MNFSPALYYLNAWNRLTFFYFVFLYLVFRWFNFERVIKALIAEKVYYLNLEQLQGIIQLVCFIEDEDEVATMLDFYHDLGVLVRHRNTVVLRAQWLIEVFRQLITIRPFNDMVSETFFFNLITWQHND